MMRALLHFSLKSNVTRMNIFVLNVDCSMSKIKISLNCWTHVFKIVFVKIWKKFENFCFKISSNFVSFNLFQLNFSNCWTFCIEMFNLIFMNIWSKSWFKFFLFRQTKILSMNFFEMKQKFMIDDDFWKWWYVNVSLNKLKINSNSFIINIISNVLSSIRIFFFYMKWWILKFSIMMCSIVSFDNNVSLKKIFNDVNIELKKMRDLLYKLCTFK